MPRLARRFPVSGCCAWLGIAVLAMLATGCGSGTRPNVVLVVIDTLRADHLGVYGYEDHPTSPALDRRAEAGVVFDNAFSTSSWTLPAFGTMYTGRLPTRNSAGVLVRGAIDLPERQEIDDLVTHQEKLFYQLDAELPTLAELLGNAGYATGAVINNAFLKQQFGVHRGFDTYDFTPDESRKTRTANLAVDDALAWLDQIERNGDRPFFLVLHLIDPHRPYQAPEPFYRRFSAPYLDQLDPPVVNVHEEIRRLRQHVRRKRPGWQTSLKIQKAAYDEEIAFVDEQLDRFLIALQERGLWDSSIVMLTSDHGEGFYDHGWFEHGNTMYDELLRVPLIVWGGDARPGRRETPASLLDLMPTILDAAGIGAPAELAGVSLWPLITRGTSLPTRPLFAERTLYRSEKKATIRWPFKAIVDIDTGERWLFNLVEDPLEHNDLATGENDLLLELLGELQQTMWAADEGSSKRESVTLDSETLEQLRALGYIR